MGPRTGLDVLEKRNISPMPGFERQTVRFVANCYTAYDTTTCLVFLCGKSVFVCVAYVDRRVVSFLSRCQICAFSVPYFLLHIAADWPSPPSRGKTYADAHDKVRCLAVAIKQQACSGVARFIDTRGEQSQ